ncbi:hypothetical protein EGH21_00350 [Halomicroarcula sp. F13]|uniref:Uncharacterized protein n=1 Tax=Haloarcula rubra TaxID=2487747 RepID=A0AAW4PK78_9EURY|nr:hypothetical protein [Halomicroarcula rubra]MBX0321467.1 hypothetical protein [Halomicroarcula rubra]
MVGLSGPTVLAGNSIVVAETVGLVAAVVYLAVRNPVDRIADPAVASDDSASRFGSTLR